MPTHMSLLDHLISPVLNSGVHLPCSPSATLPADYYTFPSLPH